MYNKSFTFLWRGNCPNFTLKLFDFTATLCRTFSNISDNSFTWDPVDIPGGTEMYLVLTDALSNSTYSGNFTIQSYAGQGKHSVASEGEPASVIAGVTEPTYFPRSALTVHDRHLPVRAFLLCLCISVYLFFDIQPTHDDGHRTRSVGCRITLYYRKPFAPWLLSLIPQRRSDSRDLS